MHATMTHRGTVFGRKRAAAAIVLGFLVDLSHQQTTAPAAFSFARAGPTVLTFEGLMDEQSVVFHVMMKAKQHADESFVLRTVSYVERVHLHGECSALPVSIWRTAVVALFA